MHSIFLFLELFFPHVLQTVLGKNISLCHHVLLITGSDPWNDSCSTKESSKKKIENGHLKYTMETGVRHLPGMRLILASGETLSKLIYWGMGLKIASLL